jgi:hypothetical protein
LERNRHGCEKSGKERPSKPNDAWPRGDAFCGPKDTLESGRLVLPKPIGTITKTSDVEEDDVNLRVGLENRQSARKSFGCKSVIVVQMENEIARRSTFSSFSGRGLAH